MDEPETAPEEELNDALFALGELYLRHRKLHRRLAQTEHVLALTQNELADKTVKEAEGDRR